MSKAEKRKSKNKQTSIAKNEIEEKSRAFVLFYATWCPFSQMFLPVFEEYARSNPKECMSVRVEDCPDLFEKYKIEYYPTVFLLKKGKVDKRLDAEPGVGLNQGQLAESVKDS